MATGRDYSGRQRKIIQRYYDNLDTITLNKLSELVSDLFLEEDPAKEARLWQRVKQALAKTPANPNRIAALLEKRDLKGLAELVTELSNPDNTARPQSANTPPPSPTSRTPKSPTSPPPASPSAARPQPSHANQLKMAYNAFKKRMKLAQRDNVLAIEPPREYPRSVWDELVKQGRLKRDGSLYRLP